MYKTVGYAPIYPMKLIRDDVMCMVYKGKLYTLTTVMYHIIHNKKLKINGSIIQIYSCPTSSLTFMHA